MMKTCCCCQKHLISNPQKEGRPTEHASRRADTPVSLPPPLGRLEHPPVPLPSGNRNHLEGIALAPLQRLLPCLLSTSRGAQTSPAADVSQCEMATAGASASQEQGSRPYMRPPCFSWRSGCYDLFVLGLVARERIQVADHLLIDWGNGVEHTRDPQYRVAFVMEPSSKASHDHAAASIAS